MVEAIRDERFFVLPHPEVAEYMQLKAADPDRWLAGMRKLQRVSRVTDADLTEMHVPCIDRRPARPAGSAAGRADPVPAQRQGALDRRAGVGVAADGSVTLRDPDGSARSLRAERLEIRRPGSRGRLRWQVVSDVAITWEQLELFGPPSNRSANFLRTPGR